MIDAIKKAVGDLVKEVRVQHGQYTIIVSSDDIVNVMQRLRYSESTDFHQLMDICGVDYLDRDPRFDVVYQLLSLSNNWRVTVLTSVTENHKVPSVVSVYKSAGWFERETYDMFGIEFSSNPDLRRILTDYDFEGYPLRRDFPLTGYTQTRYDDLLCKVVKEPVDLDEPLRDYDTVYKWKGVTDVQKRGGNV